MLVIIYREKIKTLLIHIPNVIVVINMEIDTNKTKGYSLTAKDKKKLHHQTNLLS